MKNIFSALFAMMLLAVSASAQSTLDSIRAKYQLQPMPDSLTINKIFPAIGSYSLTTDEGESTEVVVSLDSANKGMVWVEGLPEGKFKAYLKKSPATYRVIAQKSETGKSVPEGTLIYDQENNSLLVALGQKFNQEDPAGVFTNLIDNSGETEVKLKSKNSKSKIKLYQAVRVDVDMGSVTSRD